MTWSELNDWWPRASRPYTGWRAGAAVLNTSPGHYYPLAHAYSACGCPLLWAENVNHGCWLVAVEWKEVGRDME